MLTNYSTLSATGLFLNRINGLPPPLFHQNTFFISNEKLFPSATSCALLDNFQEKIFPISLESALKVHNMHQSYSKSSSHSKNRKNWKFFGKKKRRTRFLPLLFLAVGAATPHFLISPEESKDIDKKLFKTLVRAGSFCCFHNLRDVFC